MVVQKTGSLVHACLRPLPLPPPLSGGCGLSFLVPSTWDTGLPDPDPSAPSARPSGRSGSVSTSSVRVLTWVNEPPPLVEIPEKRTGTCVSCASYTPARGQGGPGQAGRARGRQCRAYPWSNTMWRPASVARRQRRCGLAPEFLRQHGRPLRRGGSRRRRHTGFRRDRARVPGCRVFSRSDAVALARQRTHHHDSTRVTVGMKEHQLTRWILLPPSRAHAKPRDGVGCVRLGRRCSTRIAIAPTPRTQRRTADPG
jgi:hypothetical protein